MKRFSVLFIAIFMCVSVTAQKHEIGVFLGGANGITDVGRTDFINPLPKAYRSSGEPALPWAIGALYRFNLNPQQGLRLGLNYAQIIDNDKTASEDYRFARGAKYAQRVFDFHLLFEYNFLPINSEQERGYSPYIFAGIGGFAYNHPTYVVTHRARLDESGQPIAPSGPDDFESVIAKNNTTKFSYSIPFGAGFKYKFNYNWVASAEVSVRPTIIDNLDMAFSTPEDFTFVTEAGLEATPGISDQIRIRNDEMIMQRQLGDHSNNDWFVFTGFTLTYTFGRPPCFCD
ncbi:MAG: DUF6089 family protein [Weeksellaceae bacterium]|nr:DUF6089 family protein [Weeksellaceae bacterium]